ncbi:putative retrotransposon gag domain-containing protein [Helianthus annuus]|nr:putative retrotransposon gag domain-containing protein [Helianthus annuus]KAJ0871750.1 putative retrotransposon gag domain-containing protein [Helianthus annuus]
MGGWTMPMWCHLFNQTFTGAARAWFDSLPPGKIESWVDFRTQFVNHFSQQQRYQRDTAEVADIWRIEDEGLEDFITRFNKECLEIGGVNEQIMRAHFKKVIRCDSLIRTITRKDGMPKEWDKLMVAAKIVAQTEESLAGHKSSYTEDKFSKGYSRDNNRRNKGKNPGWKANHSSGYDERPRYEERSRYREDARDTIDRIGYRKALRNENREKHWTPLIKMPKEVLMMENHDFKTARPMTNKKGQDPNLYCDFHKDTGHLTDDCISLRQEIEKALKSGNLSHLVRNVRKETRQVQRNDDGRDKKVRRLETHMLNGPRYNARDKGKRPFEPAWEEQQVIFRVVRGGPRRTHPVVITGIMAIMRQNTC